MNLQEYQAAVKLTSEALENAIITGNVEAANAAVADSKAADTAYIAASGVNPGKKVVARDGEKVTIVNVTGDVINNGHIVCEVMNAAGELEKVAFMPASK